MIGAIFFAQLATPIHRVFDPVQIEKFVSIKQIFSPSGFKGLPAKAPDLTITTLEGRQFTLKNLSSQNQLVVINFWASWCRPCIQEMPHLERIHQGFRDKGVVFLGIATQDSASAVRTFLAKQKITYEIVLDDQDKITSAFGGVRVLPTTIFVDSENNIVKIHKGYLAEKALNDDLENLLPK